jgi:hypothetical protein
MDHDRQDVSTPATRCAAGIMPVAVSLSNAPPTATPSSVMGPERFMLTAQTEVTDRMLIFGQRHLRTILAQYEAHYNGRRPHRSRQLHPPRPAPTILPPTSPKSSSSVAPSLVASSANTNEPPKTLGQDW